ncbi:MAG TPA: helix-turn-helix transcriptional regulator [Acidiferrobacterales bacterium]|jgi:transcriptional regulator with XRE-family HTH domain
MKEKILLGKQIRHLRTRRRFNQRVLAERARIGQKYLSNIERGKENPALDTLLRLCRVLKVEPWEIFIG